MLAWGLVSDFGCDFAKFRVMNLILSDDIQYLKKKNSNSGSQKAYAAIVPVVSIYANESDAYYQYFFDVEMCVYLI